jgi:hypothetical protein
VPFTMAIRTHAYALGNFGQYFLPGPATSNGIRQVLFFVF